MNEMLRDKCSGRIAKFCGCDIDCPWESLKSANSHNDEEK